MLRTKLINRYQRTWRGDSWMIPTTGKIHVKPWPLSKVIRHKSSTDALRARQLLSPRHTTRPLWTGFNQQHRNGKGTDSSSHANSAVPHVCPEASGSHSRDLPQWICTSCPQLLCTPCILHECLISWKGSPKLGHSPKIWGDISSLPHTSGWS